MVARLSAAGALGAAIGVERELPHIVEDLVARVSDLDYVIGVRWRR